MPIQDQTADLRPPVFHCHQYSAADDLVADLNAWAIGLWSPYYTQQNPAFQLDGSAVLHYNQSGTFTAVVPDGFWIVFNANGAITVLSDQSFQAQYVLNPSA